MPDALPLYDSGDYVPCKAADGVLGGRFVKISAAPSADGNPTVAHAGAGEKVFGVCQFDAAAAQDFHVTVARGSLIHAVTAGAAVAVGAGVQSDAAGKAITLAAGIRAGTAINAAAADGDTIYVALEV
jgi:hypothetical protein